MSVDKYIGFRIASIVLYAIWSFSSYGTPIFRDHSLTLSGLIGYTDFKDPVDQQLVISHYVTDLLTNSHKHAHPSVLISAKQQLNFEANKIHKIMLGPALYFQKLHYSGDVWELMLPEFYNYQYDYTSNNVNFLIEGDLYFNPVSTWLIPFATAGLGFGVAYVHYDDYALPGIDPVSERHHFDSSIKGIYQLGAGLVVPVNPNWSINLRYAYIHMGKVHTTPNSLGPIKFVLNNQNILIGINYSI
ncbi:TPA: outer membrane protein [Legionella pneumophila]